MKSKRLSDGLRNAGGDDEIIAVAKQFLDGMKPGDLLWVKHRQTSWWPAQVVDENTVSGRYKPHKRTSTTILVRLYGTYKYLFVDPMKCLSEFEDALKRHKGDMQMMFQKALKKASPESISKTEGSKSSKLDASGHEEVKQLGRKRMKLMGDSAKSQMQSPSSNPLSSASRNKTRITRCMSSASITLSPQIPLPPSPQIRTRWMPSPQISAAPSPQILTAPSPTPSAPTSLPPSLSNKQKVLDLLVNLPSRMEKWVETINYINENR